jgi:hypothetical protein
MRMQFGDLIPKPAKRGKLRADGESPFIALPLGVLPVIVSFGLLRVQHDFNVIPAGRILYKAIGVIL